MDAESTLLEIIPLASPSKQHSGPSGDAHLEMSEDDEGPEESTGESVDLPSWQELSQARQKAIVEALIFAADQPLLPKDLRSLLGIGRRELNVVLESLRNDLSAHHRGIELQEIAGGLVFRTRAELAPWLRALVRLRPMRFSRASLETLAIVAYRQPVTRADVEDTRGVESGSILRSLLEKRMIRILGRKDDAGRPMIYGTTREFLQTFGLKDLTSLPTLRDLESLVAKSKGPDPAKPSEDESAISPGKSKKTRITAKQARLEPHPRDLMENSSHDASEELLDTTMSELAESALE